MHAIKTGIDIAAPPWRVWRVLTDFDAYPAWNPFLIRVQGRPAEGARLRVRIEIPGRRRSASTLKARVVALETGRALRWRGRLPPPPRPSPSEEIMYVNLRRYPKLGAPRPTVERSLENELVPGLKERPGFRGYWAF